MKMPVLKVAEEGFDIRYADPKDLTIDSTRNQFKVYDDGIETFSLNSGNGYSWTKTITHNLGYRPQVLCYAYYVHPNDDMTGMDKIERYTFVPYSILSFTTPLMASLVGNVVKSTTQVTFKFYQDTSWNVPAPQNYTLDNMKMRYIIFIDRE